MIAYTRCYQEQGGMDLSVTGAMDEEKMKLLYGVVTMKDNLGDKPRFV